MNNITIQVKIKQRLNKLSSNDYDNIEPWQILEAFNKAQLEWVRKNLHGTNMYKEGDEASKRRIDDLQILLKEFPLESDVFETYIETTNFPPEDYLEFKKVTGNATKECCTKPRPMMIYLGEEVNAELCLKDEYKKPSFEWSETFCTILDNKIRVYNKDFDLQDVKLTYYRKPVNLEFINIVNPYTGVTSQADVLCEFKDDIVEILIDETVRILAGDIENFNQMQRSKQSADENN